MSVTQHLEAAAGFIAVAESGDAKREAYVKAADEIIAAQAEAPTLTQAQIGERLGKGSHWVGTLLAWRKDPARSAQTMPFARGEHQQRYVERKVPTRHEDRVEMATKLLSDPQVAKTVAAAVTDPSTKAGRLISQQVHEHEAERRREQAEKARQKALDRALPLPAYMADMVVKMNEWSLGLAALVDDLDELPEGRGRELVADAARGLAEQAQRWVDKLEPKPELRVIEGRSRAAS